MPAAENPTVAMVEAAYRHHGLDARYLNCEVAPEALGDAVRGGEAMGWVGFNCSIPHKVAVIEHLDGLGESAEVIGAVNCVVERDGRWIGENTDGQGFLEALRTVVDPAGKVAGDPRRGRRRARDRGRGGAGRGGVDHRRQPRARSAARSWPRCSTAARRTRADFVPWTGDYAAPEGTDILVNATSIGLFPDVDARVPLDPSSLRPAWSSPT